MSALTPEVARLRAAAGSQGLAAAAGLSGGDARAEVLLLAVEVGLLDGLLEHTRDVVLHHAHPWHESSAETADQDPHTQARFGQAFAVRSAAAALLAEAVRAVDDGAPGADQAVAAGRAYVARRGSETANDLVGVLGASSASTRHGLDRHWRALRAVAVTHPPRPLVAPGRAHHEQGTSA